MKLQIDLSGKLDQSGCVKLLYCSPTNCCTVLQERKDFINRLEAEPTMRGQKGSKHVRNSGCGRKKPGPCYI